MRQDRWSMDVQKVPQGMGSGFFWDDKGHIVTNYHVIRGAADIKVALIDQSVWSAKVSLFGHHGVSLSSHSHLSAAYSTIDDRQCLRAFLLLIFFCHLAIAKVALHTGKPCINKTLHILMYNSPDVHVQCTSASAACSMLSIAATQSCIAPAASHA